MIAKATGRPGTSRRAAAKSSPGARSLSLSLFLYMYVYVYIYIYIYVYVCIYIYIYICMYLCIYIFVLVSRRAATNSSPEARGEVSRAQDLSCASLSLSLSLSMYMYLYMCLLIYRLIYLYEKFIWLAETRLAQNTFE